MIRSLALCCLSLWALVQDPQALVERLNEESVQARNEAYLQLLREKPRDALPLIEAQAPNWRVEAQELALYIAQSYPTDQSLPCLKRWSTAKPALLAAGAGAQLLRLGYSENEQELLKTLRRPGLSAADWSRIVPKFYGLRSAELTRALVERIRIETDPNALRTLLEHFLVVEEASVQPAVQARLSQAQLPAEPRISLLAYLLARGDESRVQDLLPLLQAEGASALTRHLRFFQAAPRMPEPLLAWVAKIAESSASYVAQSALTVLAQFATAKDLAVLERLVDHKDITVSKAALDALLKRTGTVPRESLLRTLQGPDPARALAAADALRRADDDSGYARVCELARQSSAQQAEALRVLSRFVREDSGALLIEALAAEDLAVRRAAEQGLREFLPKYFPYRRFDWTSTSYRAEGSREQRASGLTQIRAFWDSARKR